MNKFTSKARETAPGVTRAEGGKAEQSPTHNTNSINAGKEEVKP